MRIKCRASPSRPKARPRRGATPRKGRQRFRQGKDEAGDVGRPGQGRRLGQTRRRRRRAGAPDWRWPTVLAQDIVATRERRRRSRYCTTCSYGRPGRPSYLRIEGHGLRRPSPCNSGNVNRRVPRAGTYGSLSLLAGSLALSAMAAQTAAPTHRIWVTWSRPCRPRSSRRACCGSGNGEDDLRPVRRPRRGGVVDRAPWLRVSCTRLPSVRTENTFADFGVPASGDVKRMRVPSGEQSIVRSILW